MKHPRDRTLLRNTAATLRGNLRMASAQNHLTTAWYRSIVLVNRL